MTLYIHIGFGKTGTTAIQDFFFQNRAQLKEKGLIYPEIGLQGTGHHELAALGCQQLPDSVRADYQGLSKLLDANPHCSVFLSSENFCFTSPNCVREIGSLLDKRDVRIAFYVRRQLRLIESAFLEWQKVGEDYRGTIERFFTAHERAFDFSVRILPWVKAFGEKNIIARLYDKQIIGEDVRADILQMIGMMGSIEIGQRKPSNESLLAEFSFLISHYDTFAPDRKKRQIFIEELLDLSRRLRPVDQCALIDESLRARIMTAYMASNIEFSERFLGSEERQLLCK